LGDRPVGGSVRVSPKPELHTKGLPAARWDVEVQAALIKKLVSGRARPRGFERKLQRTLSAVSTETTRQQRKAFAAAELSKDAAGQLGETLRLLIEKADEVQSRA
jgi:hypothetical protein